MNAPWQDAAACKGHPTPDLWHPTISGSTQEAKAVCRTCLVAQECGEAAIEDRTLTGIWGGMTDAERTALRPKRAQPVARCGTHSGYVSHRNRGEDACAPCKRAKAEYARSRWLAADKRRQPNP